MNSLALTIRLMPQWAVEAAAYEDVWYRLLAPIVFTIWFFVHHSIAPFVWLAVAIGRIRESVLMYFFREVRRTVQQGEHTLILEYLNATALVLFGVALLLAPPGGPVARFMETIAPVPLAAALSIATGVLQGIAIVKWRRKQRGEVCIIAFFMWNILSIMVFRRVGFNVIHAFTLPLAFGLWLSIFMLDAGGRDDPGRS